MSKDLLFKDLVLVKTAENLNVACFASFGPDGTHRYTRIRGLAPDYPFENPEAVVRKMYEMNICELVNVRTFHPDKPEGNPFFRGDQKEKHGFDFKDPSEVARCVAEQFAKGLYVIINENIDPRDGGVSGVAFGDVVEFAACATPRCVDEDHEFPCAALSREMFCRLVQQVYGFELDFPYDHNHRIEFSVHPGPVGYYGDQMVFWQTQKMLGGKHLNAPPPRWPNRFSIWMGDKAYGLLIAYLMGFPVPHTYVVGRVLPMFEFGTRMHNGQGRWTRPCPAVPIPGLFTTARRAIDPFALVEREDPTDDKKILSLLSQEGVRPGYSGPAKTDTTGKLMIEGIRGQGDRLMVGEVTPERDLPRTVTRTATELGRNLSVSFDGPVHFEWVFDDKTKEAWLIQLHVEKSETEDDVIFPGNPTSWETFAFKPGDLEQLRIFVEGLKGTGVGIKLITNVSILGHVGDIPRNAEVPTRRIRPGS